VVNDSILGLNMRPPPVTAASQTITIGDGHGSLPGQSHHGGLRSERTGPLSAREARELKVSLEANGLTVPPELLAAVAANRGQAKGQAGMAPEAAAKLIAQGGHSRAYLRQCVG
jgi:hypothetical protein